MVINPLNIQFARGTGSKDKRMTWAPEDIKRFVIDQNKDKSIKKQMEMKRN
jgi:hypothetical protein